MTASTNQFGVLPKSLVLSYRTVVSAAIFFLTKNEVSYSSLISSTAVFTDGVANTRPQVRAA